MGSLANTSKTNLGKTPEDSDSEMVDAPDVVGYDLSRGGKDDVKVEYFYGDRAKLDTFLMQLKVVFKLNPVKYQKAATQVLFASMHLKGAAQDWFQPILKEYIETSDPDKDVKMMFGYFAKFEEGIKQVFGTINEERAASRKIYTLKQTGSAASYFSEFQKVAKELRWEDEDAFAEIFYNGLKESVRRQMMKPPATYKGMVDEAITIDNRLYELRLEGGGPRKQERGRGGYHNQRGYHFKGRKSYGDPMDLDAMTRKGRDHPDPRRGRGGARRFYEENKNRERQRKENLCYECDKPGHHARDCPQKKSARGLHMMNMESDGADGSVAKKADTTEMTLSPAEGTGKTAQKDHHKSDSHGRLGESDIEQMDEEFWSMDWAKKAKRSKGSHKARKNKFDALLEGEKASEAHYNIRRKVAAHAESSWHFCYEDDCQIHLASKTENEWFPHSDGGSMNPRTEKEKGQETLAMMRMEAQDETILSDDDTKTIVRTHHWKRVGNKIVSDRTEFQRERRTVNIQKCRETSCMQFGQTHAHTKDGRPFSMSHWQNWDAQDPKDIVHGKGYKLIDLHTHYWDRRPGEDLARFNPGSAPRRNLKYVLLLQCVDGSCTIQQEHTHDTYNERPYYVTFSEETPTSGEPAGAPENREPDTPPPSYRELAVMEQGPADEILYQKEDLALLRTHYWDLGQGDRKGRWYDPYGQPKDEKLTIMIKKCKNQCVKEEHTHDTINGTWCRFAFTKHEREQPSEETEWWLNQYKETQGTDYEMVVSQCHLMVFTTHYYEIRKVRNQEMLTFNPSGPRQDHRRPVSIRGCYDYQCPQSATYHSHDTADGTVATYDPLAQTIGGLPARLTTLDQEEEWEEINSEEVEDAQRSESEESEPETKFRITRIERNWVKIVTNYWEYKECDGCNHSRDEHHHVIYRPKGRPRAKLNSTTLSFCQNWECAQAPTLHIHGSGEDVEVADLLIRAEEAERVWGTTKPDMSNLLPTRKDKDESAVQLDGRANKAHPYGHFTCADLSCPWYYKMHQHMRNISPDDNNKGIYKEEYWKMRECADTFCLFLGPHVHSKND